MKIGVDTSVVLRLLVGEPAEQAILALETIEGWRKDGASIVVSGLVLAETYYALQHHYLVPKAEALRQLRAFVLSPWIASDEGTVEILKTPRLASAKPGFVDRMIHAEYQQRQSADFMATFEKAAGKLPGTRVLLSGS